MLLAGLTLTILLPCLFDDLGFDCLLFVLGWVCLLMFAFLYFDWCVVGILVLIALLSFGLL